MLAESLEVLIFDEERFPVLLQEEADPSSRERGAALERVFDDGGQIEVLDHLERSPDLLPSPAKLGSVEQVDERALERRHADRPACVRLSDDAAVLSDPVSVSLRTILLSPPDPSLPVLVYGSG